jgi:hypothetical protein
VSNTWDTAGTVWDGAEWQGTPPTAPDWSKEWLWWWQNGNGSLTINLNPYVIEARWTTESHTMNDGTFRGDLQPGKITVKMWDPLNHLGALDKFGAMFAWYKPTNQAWCWFYDTYAQGLYTLGDPLGADRVFTGVTWPARYTNPGFSSNFNQSPASVSNRLAAIVGLMNTSTFRPPAVVVGAIAAQSQQLPQQLGGSDGKYPSLLEMVRTAAANGVAWLSATPPTTDGGRFGLTLNYARWETTNSRVLDASQIIAGPPTTASADWVISAASWQGVKGDGTTNAWSAYSSGNVGAWGYQGPSSLRIVGDVSGPPVNTAAPENPGVSGTTTAMFNAYSDPTQQVLDTLDVQSGIHRTPAGGVSPTAWDPYAHTFAPVDVVTLTHMNPTATFPYRVTSSDHRLTGTIWQTTHHLEKYAAATPLP